MARFFVAPEAIAEGAVTLTGADAHHAATVLRLRPGDAATVLDGGGLAHACVVEAADRAAVRLRVAATTAVAMPPTAVTLVQGLPKGDKLEWIVQKATELGVARIVPVAARRSVMKVEAGRAEAKAARWRAIAREAAEQCERGDMPAVEAPVALEAAAWPAGAPAYVLAERSDGLTLPRALPPAPPPALAILVGPEGGWDPAELAALTARGVVPVSLGPRILRTETAGLAALAIVMAAYELGAAAGSGNA